MTHKTLVISYNVDMRQPYVYDLSADDEYRPYDANMTFSPDEHVFLDNHSFPRPMPARFGVPVDLPLFCSLEEFYFFRTILQREARSPTVVLHEDRPYHLSLTFAEFLEWFSKTYKIIFYRWRSLEPSIQGAEHSPSMQFLFQASLGHEQRHTFREWMNRVQ